MGLLSALGKITGIEKNIKWAMSKELIVDGPNFLGRFKIYISKIGKIAVIIPKSDMATIVSGFVVVSGVVLTAFQYPASELIIGAGIGYLFKTVADKVKPK